MGGACDPLNNVLCVGTLTCQNGQCATPLGAGTPCNAARDYLGGCDRNLGLYCPAGANAKCTAYATATAGQACAGTTYCIGGSQCFANRCVAPAADNATCNTTSGPPCMVFANCTAGTCTLLDHSTCH